MPPKDVLLWGLLTGEIGSGAEGPRLEADAPDFTLKSPDGKQSVTLSTHRGKRAVVLAEGDELTLDLLPDEVRGRRPPRRPPGKPQDLGSLTQDLVQFGLGAAGDNSDNLHSQIVNRVERELISQVMAACDDVQIKAAARLGINRNTLHKKLKEYKLEREE